MKNIIEKIIQLIGEDFVLIDEPMRNHTSFKIGGPAKAVIQPDSIEKIQKVVSLLDQYKIKYYILGNGTNVLFPDEGYNGIVVKIADSLSEIRIEGDKVYAQAGALLSRVSKMSARASLAGLEFASGIPGSIGGAVVMNAGAYGGEMKDVVIEVTVIDQQGHLKVYKNDALKFGYRTSVIKEKGYTVLHTVMQLREGGYDEIWNKIDELNVKRTTKQPLHLPSAGSTFKRPPGHYAGKLIEDAGLKGLTFGGAQVSDLHCGFVVNIDQATYDDVVTLMKIVRDTVYEQFGVELEPEVKIIERV
jgi:UDP-N-acetylmuramate dehydrogenase